jgi:ribose/xylose/arabinose/galactoside ABC-type transport system permease subunit
MSTTEAPARPATPATPTRRWDPGALVRRRGALLIVAMIVIAFASAISHPAFLHASNISFVLADSMVITFLALGQTFVMIARGIDLSIAPIMGLSAVIVGFRAQDQGMGLLPAIFLAAGVGLVLGLGNALLVAIAGLPPIIATLGTLSIYGGLQFVITGGRQVDHVPSVYTDLGSSQMFPGVPWALIIGIVAVIAVAYTLRHTVFGRQVYAVGDEVEAAFRAGIPVKRTLFICYLLCGLFAGLAGLLYLLRHGSAVATTGSDDNSNLTAIAAALIGGTALTGGRGNAVGSILGAIFLSLTLTAMVFAHIPPIWQPAGVGALILLAVVADPRARKNAMRRLRSKAATT